ncbi:MAG: hypothetical protein ACI9R3_001677 [Verrucomicrobiales bacterium]
MVGGVGGFALAKNGSVRAVPDKLLVDGQLQERGVASRESTLEAEVAKDSSNIATLIDSAALGEQWESFGDDARGFTGRQRLLARWAEVDPEGGYEYFVDDRNTWISFLAEWALIDPQAATARLISEKKIGAIASIPQAVVLRSPKRCLELVAIWEDTGRTYNWADGIVTIAFAKLFANDTAKALEMADALSPKARAEAMAGIATAMARGITGTGSARKWAEALADPQEREAAIGAVAVELGKSNPDAAASLLAELDDPFDWGKPGALILEEMIKTDPNAAIDWAVRHFDTQVHDSEWSRSFLSKAFQYAGEEATILAIARTADKTLQAKLIRSLTRGALPYQTGEIFATVDGLSSLAVKTQMRQALLGSLAGADVPSAIGYIESLADDDARGHAASSIANNVPEESVPETFEWLQSLGLTEDYM